VEQIKITGIVTHTADFRDFDRMITILSPDEGVIGLCLKGCRKPNAKLRAAGQMFCFADFELIKRPTGYIMTGCSVRDSFFELAMDLERMQAAGRLCSLTNLLFEAQEDAQRELFALLLSAITTLAHAKRVNPSEVMLLCAIRMLDICGYQPQLDSCVSCGAPVGAGERAFSAELGGVLCDTCAGQDANHIRMSAGAISSIRMAMELPNTKMATFHFGTEIRKQLQQAISAFFSERLEQKIRLD